MKVCSTPVSFTVFVISLSVWTMNFTFLSVWYSRTSCTVTFDLFSAPGSIVCRNSLLRIRWGSVSANSVVRSLSFRG